MPDKKPMTLLNSFCLLKSTCIYEAYDILKFTRNLAEWNSPWARQVEHACKHISLNEAWAHEMKLLSPIYHMLEKKIDDGFRIRTLISY